MASHGDKRGYLLDAADSGDELWRVDLAVETAVGDERLYAYPNHAHAADGRVAFLTGNTYPVEGREAEGRHPNDHRIVAFDGVSDDDDSDGTGDEDGNGNELWDADLAGFVHGIAADGSRLAVPCAQNFRVRDPDTHAIRLFDLADGESATDGFAGIPTAAALADNRVAVVEEPISYHDDGEVRGSYAVHSRRW